MNKSKVMILFVVLWTLVTGAFAEQKPVLELIHTTPLPELKDGDFDHFAADVAGNRLFATAEENSKVLVFDLKTNKLIHTITDLKAPHSLLYRSDLKKLLVVDSDLGDAGAGEVVDIDGVGAARGGELDVLDAVKVHDDVADVARQPRPRAVGGDVHDLGDIGAVEHQRIEPGLPLNHVAAVAGVPDKRIVAGAELRGVIATAAADDVIAITADTNKFQDEMNAIWEKLYPAFQSETLPENFPSFTSSTSEAAVRSSSHDEMTLPRRQTSATSARFRSYW